jgi:uncharacterized sulfatase
MTKNIVWITLDSIRADRTPFGDHSLDTMPVLDEFASRPNTVGTTCTAHGIWSLPSVASMMTGLWPSRHGTGLHNEVLPSEITTVPERLSAASYRTVGISQNSYFSPETGLGRGFDEFHHPGIKDLFGEAGISGTLSFLKNIRRYSGGLTTEKRRHSPDYLLNEFLKDKLQSLASGDQPFALFAHYSGAHHPYSPSPAFRDSFELPKSMTPEDVIELSFEVTSDPYTTMAEPGSVTDEEWDAIRALYDGLLKQVDSLMGRIIETLDSCGLTEDTIVVFTSDHGDLLGEQGFLSHKLFLHDSLIQVPVVVHGSERVAGADHDNLQHIDIVQTILDEVGASTDGMHGDTLPGASRGFTISQRGAETADKTLDRVREHNPNFDHDKIQLGLLTALRSDGWKTIRGEKETVLYELPDEAVDRSSDYPEQTDQHSAQIEAWLEEFGEPLFSDEQADFSDEVEDRLADLGYIVQ